MTTDKTKRYEEALSKKLAELSETLANRRPIAIEFTPEACERIVLAAQRELAVVTLDRHSRLLREVKAAMARIEDGSYGVCENCDESIAAKRLDAVPWARYCVALPEQPGQRSEPGLAICDPHADCRMTLSLRFRLATPRGEQRESLYRV